MKTRNAERKAQLAAYRRSLGVCIDCGGRVCERSRRHCEYHLTQRVAANARSLEANGKPVLLTAKGVLRRFQSLTGEQFERWLRRKVGESKSPERSKVTDSPPRSSS